MKKAALVILAIFLLVSPVLFREPKSGLHPPGLMHLSWSGESNNRDLQQWEQTRFLPFMELAQAPAVQSMKIYLRRTCPLNLRIYYSETPAGASFDNPDSFKSGTPIATFTMRMETILNVQEPNVGVLMAFGESIQSNTAPFTLGSTTYTLGHNNLNHRFSLFGQGFRQVEEPVQAFYIVGGNAMITGSGIQP
jgi:hypothetical protein